MLNNYVVKQKQFFESKNIPRIKTGLKNESAKVHEKLRQVLKYHANS